MQTAFEPRSAFDKLLGDILTRLCNMLGLISSSNAHEKDAMGLPIKLIHVLLVSSENLFAF